MSFTITDLKTALERKLHGTTIDKLRSPENLFYEAASIFLLDCDPQETKRTVAISNALYDKVYNYSSPTDLKGNKVIDIKPQANRKPGDRYSQRYNENFDLATGHTNQPQFTIEFNNSVKTLRINAPQLTSGILLNTLNSTTENGTWTTGGSASNISSDTVIHATGTGSVRFDLDAGADPSNGDIVNSTMQAVDLTDHENDSDLFAWVYFSSVTGVTNVRLRWGSDASNYWESTVTTTHEGNALATGWNLLRFNWATATQTATPDVANVDYLQVNVEYDGTANTGVRVDNIISNIGIPYEIEYYSKFLFRDATTGAFQEKVTSDSNIINLDTDSFNVYLELVAEFAFQQTAGRLGQGDINFHESKYQSALAKYKRTYKSEMIKPKEFYYSNAGNRNRYRKFIGRGPRNS